MSVTVRQLNGDCTFLLIFSPETNPTPFDLRSANGAFSVLIDPWLVGSSVTAASWFAITDRVEPSAIQHLSELEDEPDVVICSQNKQDHTNKDTLLQLRPEGKTIIVAEPAAAKVIKSWNHFDPYRIHSMNKYDHRVKFGNTLRLHIPPSSPYGDAGELTVAFIPAKNYMTGLHNAFGLTYRPPTKNRAVAAVSTIDLPNTAQLISAEGPPSIPSAATIHPPLSPPMHSPLIFFSPQADNSSEETFVCDDIGVPTSSEGQRPVFTRASDSGFSSLRSPASDWHHRFQSNDRPTLVKSPQLPTFDFDRQCSDVFAPLGTLLTPPASPDARTTARKSSFGASSLLPLTSPDPSLKARSDITNTSQQSTIHPGRPKVLSVLYTPHGMALSDLKPYVQHHLVRLPGALPLSLLLHSFDHAENPWFFGGNIMTGAAGGVQIAHALMAKCWISAHDEDKDDRGLAVKLLKTRKTRMEDIRRQLSQQRNQKSTEWMCDVRSLNVGEDFLLSHAARDEDLRSFKFGPASSSASMMSLRPTSSPMA